MEGLALGDKPRGLDIGHLSIGQKPDSKLILMLLHFCRICKLATLS